MDRFGGPFFVDRGPAFAEAAAWQAVPVSHGAVPGSKAGIVGATFWSRMVGIGCQVGQFAV